MQESSKIVSKRRRADVDNDESATRTDLGEQQDATGKRDLGRALKAVFAWRNYSVYLVTLWFFYGFSVLDSFLSLYLYEIGWAPVVIGAVLSLIVTVAAVLRLLGGYIGDVFDRKWLAVIAVAVVAIYYFIFGITVDFVILVCALLLSAVTDLVKGGSSAYIMDNIPKEHSGLGLSLFQAGRMFGVPTLIVLWFLVQYTSFQESYRLVSLTGGIALLLCATVRARYLTSSAENTKRPDIGLEDFVRANARTMRTLLAIMPGVILIVAIDALSDSLFYFGALIYSSGIVSMSGMMIMVSVPLLMSVPLILKTGRASDKYSTKRVGLLIYSVMPISAGLLVIASFVPHWAPQYVIDIAEAMLPGLGVLFATPFLAIVMKYVNDALWWLVILTIIQKNLPRRDTAKTLAVFWFVIYVCSSVGPFLGGLVFTYMAQVYLFVIVFCLNVIILLSIGGLGLLERERRSTRDNQQENSEGGSLH